MNSTSPAAAASSTPSGRLGTFAGVFTPSILTILGIVLFLRLGYVVGVSGLAVALLVIAAANVISVLTALSVSAIATNLRVKAGGDYYLISRTLGPGFGAAIGLVLFLAQAVSIGFYCIGFAEAVVPMLTTTSPMAVHLVAFAAVCALGLLAWTGADLATRFQYIVMVLLSVGLAAFVWGASQRWGGGTLIANWSPPRGALPFWVVFAIFFPAVTGFTQGVSMSGDLKNPSRSIPMGVLGAVALSAVVYVACALLFAAALPAAELRRDTAAMKTVAIYGPLIDLGVMAATLSSALASFLGAPRILQSLARDEMFKWLNPFAKGVGADNNPRRAVLPTFAVASAVVALGDLDLVAPVVSMFFLLSYGLLNYATYHEARSGSPSFRPTFRYYDRRIGLVGAIVCLGVMLAIDMVAGMVATIIVYAIYRFVEQSDAPARWTDGRRAYHLQLARDHLRAAADEPEHARAWRPQLVVFSDSAERRVALLTFARWVEGRAGLTTVVKMIVDDSRGAVDRRQAEMEKLAAEIKAAGSRAFPLVVVGPKTDDMVACIVQSAGVGPLRINTAIANWPVGDDKAFYQPLGVAAFGRHVAMSFRLGTNLLLLDADAEEWEALERMPKDQRVIDVWWRDSHTGELMLLLAYLMTRSDEWGDARIRMLAAPESGESAKDCQARLTDRLAQIRISAEAVAVEGLDEERVVETSRASAMVFMPFQVHGGRFYSPFGWEIGPAMKRLPITALALAAQDVDLHADPDQETDAQVADNAQRRD